MYSKCSLFGEFGLMPKQTTDTQQGLGPSDQQAKSWQNRRRELSSNSKSQEAERGETAPLCPPQTTTKNSFSDASR